MKKIGSIFLTLLLIIIGFTGCQKLSNDMLIGSWKLVEVFVSNAQGDDIVDYSNENITYDFQKNNRLVIRGNVPIDFYVFKDFQPGKHSYKYYFHGDCPNCKPMFFQIDRNKNYKCSAPIWGLDIIVISGEEIVEGTTFYWWQKLTNNY